MNATIEKTRADTSALLEGVTVHIDRAALLLDLDGTLARFESAPSAVGPDPARTDLLQRLQQALDGRLAVVSGRAIADIDRILEGAVSAVAGVHGLQRRDADGVTVEAPPHPELCRAQEVFEAFARARPGVLVEIKPQAVALHFRQAPEAADEAIDLARRLAHASGISLQEGACVAELRTPGDDKGAALRKFMAAPPFAGAVPIFVGDDLTDEAAFVEATRQGGAGVLVGPERRTAAVGRLKGPDEVMSWLEDSLEMRRFIVGGGA